MSIAPSASEKPFVSELADPRQRFLARVVDHALSDGWRSPDDFLRHFPPSAVVASLAHSDELRVKLLVAATGTHEKIARKKSVASAAEDLELALAEETTTPAALVQLYPTDEKVRHLDSRKLWSFAVEDEFHRTSASGDPAKHKRAAARMTFMIDCALAEGLITLRDVTDGLTFDEIAAALPVADVRALVKHSLQIARAGTPLTEERFLAVVPLASLVSHVVLDHTFRHVVLDRIAAPAGLVEMQAPAPIIDEPEIEPPAPELPSQVDIPVSVEPAVSAEPTESPRTDEDEVTKRVVDRLKLIDRLPPSYSELSTAILLSIESMYADLWAVNDDDEREACIRESFPNQTLLRTAMLALIELLDPSVDTHDPIIRDADVSGLIKIVLFEERRRRDATPSSGRRSSAASSGARSRRSVPPPLPRSSAPPPLPVESGTRSNNPPPLPAEAKRD